MKEETKKIDSCLMSEQQVNHNFSHFNNIWDKKPQLVFADEVIRSILTGELKGHSIVPLIQKIRITGDKEKRNALKKDLPAFSISAICENGHKKENIVRMTGLLQIDVDNIENPESLKEKLRNDPYVFFAYISPSGHGLKCVIDIQNKKIANIFPVVSEYFKTTYGVEIDKQLKDESRLCYYSYDPAIYVNNKYQAFDYRISGDDAAVSNSTNKHEKITPANNAEKSESVKDIEQIISEIELKAIDITGTYLNWLKIGFALADEFGANGEKYYHRISKFHQDYNFDKCHDQFKHCINSTGEGIKIGTFYKIASDHGICLTKKRSDSNENLIFYKPVFNSSGEFKDIKIDYAKWTEVIYQLGFRRFDIDKNFVFVKITNQIIEEVTVTHIQDAFMDYLNSLTEDLGGKVTREYLIGKFYRNPAHYFNDKRLNLLRPKTPFFFNSDTKDECFIYFNNGFECCNAHGYTLKSYSELNGLIWRDQIVDHEFNFLDITTLPPAERGVFSNFVYNIAGKNNQRYDSLCSILGYLLHSYYDTKLKAAVLTDCKIADVPSGRTGKTLLCQSLRYVKKYSEINGRDFDTSNKHKYQEVKIDTQIVNINDVRKNFAFECLFNDITEGIVIDKKNLAPFRILVKIILSTNQTILIDGSSAKDRAIEFELADYYSDKFSPEDEFKHWFFRDWDSAEWSRFYNFFLNCITIYLKDGIIQAPAINLNRRKLLENTNSEFVEFMDNMIAEKSIVPDKPYDKKVLYESFIGEYTDFRDMKGFKQRKFTDWLRTYAKYSNHFSPIDPARHERKSGDVRTIIFPSP